MRNFTLLIGAAVILIACCGGSSGQRPPDTGPVCFNVHPYSRGDVSVFEVPDVVRGWEPDRGECVYDSAFGTRVCKAVDAKQFAAAESGGVVRPVYSRWRHDNSSGEFYFVVKDGETPPGSGNGQLVVLKTADNSVVKTVSEVSSGEGAEFRWDHSGSRPKILYYIDECRFNEYDLDTGQSQTVHDFSADFPGCGRILNDVEGDSSGDSRYWAWMVQGPYDGSEFPMLALITYDRQADAILARLDLARYQAMGGQGSQLPRPNMVDVSPSGAKVVALWPRTDREDIFDGPHAYNLDFTAGVKVCNDESHSGWARDAAGNEVYVCQVNNDNWANAPADTLAYTDVQTGQTEVMVFHEDLPWDVGGFHFGRFHNPAINGWVYLTTYSETSSSTSWMRNQAVMIQVKPYAQHPLVWRVAATHNNYPNQDGYPREAYSPISGDGRRIWFGSDWLGGDGTVDTYAVELPERWWETVLDSPTACPAAP